MRLLESSQEFSYSDLQVELEKRLARTRDLHDQYVAIQKHDIGRINAQLEKYVLEA